MTNTHEILAKIGLSSPETRVYLALLKLREAKTGLLCKETEIASSNIYSTLHSLVRKGLVSYRVQNNTKTFMPNPPETLNELYLEKHKQLENEQKNIKELITTLKINPTEETQSNYK